jgi:hypothetical protein
MCVTCMRVRMHVLYCTLEPKIVAYN